MSYTNLKSSSYSVYVRNGSAWLYYAAKPELGRQSPGFPDIPISELAQAVPAVLELDRLDEARLVQALCVIADHRGREAYAEGYAQAQADMRRALGIQEDNE